jgi:CRP-like cAMP-binding protein
MINTTSPSMWRPCIRWEHDGPSINPYRCTPLSRAAARLGKVVYIAQGSTLFAEGDDAEFLYSVVAGCVITYSRLSNGDRRIVDFYFPQDLFGFTASSQHPFSADATTPTTVIRYPCDAMGTAARQDDRLARELAKLAYAGAALTAKRLTAMTSMTTQECVASILLGLMLPDTSGNRIHLIISRADIADYLGTSAAVVSQILARFHDTGLIQVRSSRIIDVPVPASLAALARGVNWRDCATTFPPRKDFSEPDLVLDHR